MDPHSLQNETEYCEQTITRSQIFQDEILPIKYYRLSVTKIRMVSEYLGLAVPLIVTVCYTWVKHQSYLLDFFRKHARLALLSYGGMLHVIRIETLLRLVRIFESGTLDDRPGAQEKPECVECEVLFDPGPDVRSADIIFIHGIKGALTKTWRQGRWGRDAVRLKRIGTASTLGPSSYENTDDDCLAFESKNIQDEDDDSQDSQEDLEEIFSRIRERQDILYKEKKGASAEGYDSETSLRLGDKDYEEKETTSKCWPRDWLPLDCPTARVIAVNYTTDPYLWSPFWSNVPPRSTLPERAWEMIAKLTCMGVGEQPIIWVGHSKGGLYIKQMLVNANESRDERDRQICEATRGILFYSVPHKGSRLAKFNILPMILKRSVELTEVQDDCEDILSLDKKFRALLDQPENKFLIKSFVETSLTLMFILYVRVVSLESADNDFGEIYGVELDHRNICKPRDRQCFLYRELVDIVKRCQNNDRLMTVF